MSTQKLQPGQVLQRGRYTVERELGRGRFAITYLACRDDGERWVIKILDPAVVASVRQPEERQRLEDMFWREALALARCGDRSPYIVKVDNPFRENGVACLPLEYMGNTTLADRPERVLSEAVALEYIRQVGEALAIVHGENLVHRDIRPANIFLVPREGRTEAVLTDFGLAMSFDAELTRTRTQEQVRGFSPIELMASGRKVGAFTDVYSLAATLYEMLTGKVPVDAFTRFVSSQPVENPKALNPAISEGTVQAILAGLALESEHRPQAVADWLQQLHISTTPTTQPESISINLPVPESTTPVQSGAASIDANSNHRSSLRTINWEFVIGVLVAGILVPIVIALFDKFVPEPESAPPTPSEQPQT